jgi:hypothetical protein
MRLRRTKDLGEYTIAAIDTDIGTIHDFYFDDQQWTIRYVVVDTGTILSGRKVLISPVALRQPAWSPLHLHTTLTWQQVASSPGVDLHKPVSRQHETEHHEHYGWPHYWEGTGVWGSWPDPRTLANAPREALATAQTVNACEDAHLRSTREVTGYHIKAIDGEIGHLEDFLFDDETWEIRYAIVDTRNWWPGKKILLRPQWIEKVNWDKREIHVRMSRETIKMSPGWDPNQPVNRDYELRLHRHYGYAPYWTNDT